MGAYDVSGLRSGVSPPVLNTDVALSVGDDCGQRVENPLCSPPFYRIVISVPPLYTRPPVIPVVNRW